jgi:hypothetical protein
LECVSNSPTLNDIKKDFAALGVNSVDLTQDDVAVGDVDITPFLRDECDPEQLSALLALCNIGYAIHLLLRLKFFLKDMYSLDNEKCQTYQPGTATKV